MATSGFRDYPREWATEGAVALITLIHLGLLVAVPEGPGVLTLAVVEAAVLLLLVGAERLAGVAFAETLPLVGSFLALVAIAGGLQYSSDSLTVAAGLLVVTVTIVLYGMHRYELVALGKVDP